jgi:hypothetical protein
MEHLAGPRTSFFFPDLRREDLPTLLENQDTAAVPRNLLGGGTRPQGRVRDTPSHGRDGKPGDLGTALEHLDPDQVSLGGYCTEHCRDYWKGLVERAVIPR